MNIERIGRLLVFAWPAGLTVAGLIAYYLHIKGYF